MTLLKIFKSLGITGTSTSLFSTGIYGVVKTVTTAIFCLFIVDRFNRRVVLMVGAAGGCFAMVRLHHPLNDI